jgi:hypothetical protein
VTRDSLVALLGSPIAPGARQRNRGTILSAEAW